MKNVTVEDIVRWADGKLICGDSKSAVKHISIDSRKMQGNDLFVPFIGEKVDGHKFIETAFKNGAAASLTMREDVKTNGVLILVKDSEKALKAIGKGYREEKIANVPVIGITGSVGKTSTREMVACALSAKYNVFSTKGNFNGQLGVPMMITEIEDEDIAVIEMGVSIIGEMDRIVPIAKPDSAVVSNIGICHIENFKKKETTLLEKLKIANFITDGTLILNGDDELLKDLKTNEHKLYYGIGENNDIKAENIVVSGSGTAFDLCFNNHKISVHLNVLGEHNVMNSLAAVSVAVTYGVEAKYAVMALEGFNGFERRMEIIPCRGFTIIDDAYNASPASASASAKVLSTLPNNGRKIAVFADMKELGKEERTLHKAFGEEIDKYNFDMTVLIGELSKETYNGMKNSPKVYFENNNDAIKYLKHYINKNDIVLFKGSHSTNMLEIINQLKGDLILN